MGLKRLVLRQMNKLSVAPLFFSLFLFLMVSGKADALHTPRILFISSYNPAFPTVFQQIEGIRSVFNDNNAIVDIEFMDSKRFNTDINLELFHNLFTYKIENSPEYDVVLTGDDNALTFALVQQEGLFLNKPIIFFGVNNVNLALEQNSNPWVTGVVEAVSMNETIQLIKRLHPNIESVVAISDGTSTGISDLDTFYQNAATFPQLHFSDLSLCHLTFEELAINLRQLNGNNAALLLSAFRDKNGNHLPFYEIMAIIRQHASVPVYHLWQHGLGKGILGGKVISHFNQAQTAAHIAQSVLNGKPVSEVDIIGKSPNRYIFDYHELDRFGIDSAHLPPGASVINQPDDFIHKHKRIILWSSVIVASESLLIALLTLSILKQRRYAAKLKRLADIVNYSNDAIISIAIDGTVLTWNKAAERIFGYTASEIRGKNRSILVPDGYRDEMKNILKKISRGSGLEKYEGTRKTKNGGLINLSITISPIQSDHGEIREASIIARDITLEKRAEEALKQSEFELSIQNHIATAFLTHSGDRLFQEVLSIVLDVFQCEFGYFLHVDPSGKMKFRIITQQTLENCRIDADGRMPWRKWLEIKRTDALPRKSGIYSHANLNLPAGHPELKNVLVAPIIHHKELIGQFAVANRPDFADKDIRLLEMIASRVAPILKGILDEKQLAAEKEKLEEKIRQTQRLEAIGTLAGGIAHDFNNILSPIMILSDMLVQNTPAGSMQYRYLKQILQASERARDIVQQILSISRRTEQGMHPIKVQPIVKEAIKLSGSVLPSTIRITKEIDEACGMVMADPSQIHQLIMNLITNAYHAMEEDGGILDVRLMKTNLPPDNLPCPEMLPGEYTCLSISDTGSGMDHETVSRIFDPYFTTKEKGKGTGLGLSVVHGIVKNCGGEIMVHSKPGTGTVFKTYFPEILYSSGTRQEVDQPMIHPMNERVLLVDDDGLVTEAFSNMLNCFGFQVTSLTSSPEALAAFRNEPEVYDIIISDMTMPTMTGDRLIAEIKKIRPDIPAILISGYNEKINDDMCSALAIDAVLMKPIAKNDMIRTLQKVLKNVRNEQDSAPDRAMFN